MKKWLERTGAPFFIIIIALFTLFNNLRHFIANRSDFDVIYRWELSGSFIGFLFLIMGVSLLFESRNKMATAYIFTIISCAILFIVGLIVLFMFDSDIGFIFDILIMLGLPLLYIALSFVKLKRIGKSELIPKHQLKKLEIVLSVAMLICFIVIVSTLVVFFVGG